MTASCWSPCRHDADAEQRHAGDLQSATPGRLYPGCRHRQGPASTPATAHAGSTEQHRRRRRHPDQSRHFTVSGLLGPTAGSDQPDRELHHGRPISPMTASCWSPCRHDADAEQRHAGDLQPATPGRLYPRCGPARTGVNASNSAPGSTEHHHDGGGTLTNPASSPQRPAGDDVGATTYRELHHGRPLHQ